MLSLALSLLRELRHLGVLKDAPIRIHSRRQFGCQKFLGLRPKAANHRFLVVSRVLSRQIDAHAPNFAALAIYSQTAAALVALRAVSCTCSLFCQSLGIAEQERCRL